jgi:iron complex transport system ATP-binding protein
MARARPGSRRGARPLLEFRNVTVIRGAGCRVLDALSVTIREGENVAILGPNGSGKSSFIQTITRELYPQSGAPGFVFRVWGRARWDVFDLRSLLGIVSNDLLHTFTTERTGLDVVLSGFFGSVGLYNMDVTPRMARKAEAVLDFLEVAHLRDRLMTEMSSGEARRLLIGRALVHDPKALVLDEPANSLDLHALFRFRDLMRKIARSGTSILLVTHTLSDIIPEIRRVVLMKGGRLIADGPKEQVLTAANIGRLFGIPVRILRRNGCYYVTG